MSSQAKIVHMIPRGVLENTYHGSFKDVISRVRLFGRCQADYGQVILTGDEPESLHSQWDDWEKSSFLIEYSYYPKIVRALRKRFPESFIAVRSHNIEPLQHLHNHGWWPSKGPFWVGYGMARLFWGDLLVKRHANVIYSISDWERTRYWQRLPGGASVEWLPYYCPEHLISTDATAPCERNRVVCMPTSVKSRKSLDLVKRFISFAELAKKQESPYEFLITGNLDSWPAPQSSAVRYTGMIDDLGPFLSAARAVCILSDLGYGFKTTIADALANGTAVVVHDALQHRFASMLGEAIIGVDVTDPESVARTLVRLSGDQPDFRRKNSEFRDQSHSILTRDFRLQNT